MWLRGTKLNSLCEPSPSAAEGEAGLVWLPSALSILSKEPLQPGPALIACWQTAACSGSAWQCCSHRAGDSCTVHVCSLSSTVSPCSHTGAASREASYTQVWSRTAAEPWGHLKRALNQLRACEQRIFHWPLVLGHLWGELRRGCLPFVKPREMWGWHAWHEVELPHIWLDLPHAEEPAKAKQGQPGASEDCSRKPPG